MVLQLSSDRYLTFIIVYQQSTQRHLITYFTILRELCSVRHVAWCCLSINVYPALRVMEPQRTGIPAVHHLQFVQTGVHLFKNNTKNIKSVHDKLMYAFNHVMFRKISLSWHVPHRVVFLSCEIETRSVWTIMLVIIDLTNYKRDVSDHPSCKKLPLFSEINPCCLYTFRHGR